VNHTAKTVIVMADTHVRTLKELPQELLTEIEKADYVIHLGDFYSLELLNDLKNLENSMVS